MKARSKPATNFQTVSDNLKHTMQRPIDTKEKILKFAENNEKI